MCSALPRCHHRDVCAFSSACSHLVLMPTTPCKGNGQDVFVYTESHVAWASSRCCTFRRHAFPCFGWDRSVSALRLDSFGQASLSHCSFCWRARTSSLCANATLYATYENFRVQPNEVAFDFDDMSFEWIERHTACAISENEKRR